MKKLREKIALILAFCMIVPLLAGALALPAAAERPEGFSPYHVLFGTGEDKDDGGVTPPDDAFDGEYAEFKGSDGSVTRVFDNGSVRTVYEDGSKAGVDYMGNQYAEAKDGTYTVRTTDGCTATEYPDGRQTLTEPDGKTTTVNTDGSFSESYRIGITLDYGADGGLTGIGFVGGAERIGVDEDGEFKNGEISGPNGASMKFTDNTRSLVTPTGAKCEYKTEGNEDSEKGETETYSITSADGTKSSWTVRTILNRTREAGQDDVATGRTVTSSGVIETPDGEKTEYENSFDYDLNGEPVSSEYNVVQVTDSQGATLWFDRNSEAIEYRNPESGAVFIVDSDGHLLENKSEEIEIKAVYDGSGQLKTADIQWKDGAHMQQREDGFCVFTLPDGTKYETDGKGNVWKDGVQIKEDSKWAEGYGPDTGDTDEPGPTSGGDDLDAFMGTWYWTETTTSSSGTRTVYYSWTLSKSGEEITVYLTVRSEGDEPESDTFRCSYSYDGTTLTLYNRIFGGGRTTIVRSGENLKSTGHGERNSTVTMHR